MTTDIVSRISSGADNYTTTVSGSAYVLKDAKFNPWDEYKGGDGRYNGVGTGSLYLGDSIETCEAEVGRENKRAFRFDLSSAGASRILDLEAWGRDNPQFSGSLLVASGSGGWEPTQPIADWAHGAGYHGIRFESHVRRGCVNHVLWHDRISIVEAGFELVDAPQGA